MKTSNKNTEIFVTFKNANFSERRIMKDELSVVKNGNKRVLRLGLPILLFFLLSALTITNPVVTVLSILFSIPVSIFVVKSLLENLKINWVLFEFNKM